MIFLFPPLGNSSRRFDLNPVRGACCVCGWVETAKIARGACVWRQCVITRPTRSGHVMRTHADREKRQTPLSLPALNVGCTASMAGRSPTLRGFWARRPVWRDTRGSYDLDETRQLQTRPCPFVFPFLFSSSSSSPHPTSNQLFLSQSAPSPSFPGSHSSPPSSPDSLSSPPPVPLLLLEPERDLSSPEVPQEKKGRNHGNKNSISKRDLEASEAGSPVSPTADVKR